MSVFSSIVQPSSPLTRVLGSHLSNFSQLSLESAAVCLSCGLWWREVFLVHGRVCVCVCVCARVCVCVWTCCRGFEPILLRRKHLTFHSAASITLGLSFSLLWINAKSTVLYVSNIKANKGRTASQERSQHLVISINNTRVWKVRGSDSSWHLLWRDEASSVSSACGRGVTSGWAGFLWDENTF